MNFRDTDFTHIKLKGSTSDIQFILVCKSERLRQLLTEYRMSVTEFVGEFCPGD